MMKQGLFRGLMALAVLTVLLTAPGPSVQAQPVASIALPSPRGTLRLHPSCNNIALTFDSGTPSETAPPAGAP